MLIRKVEYAVGFTDGTWTTLTVNVPETLERVLDEDEVSEKAGELAKLFEFGDREISFRHLMYISPPDGGYDEDRF